MEKSRRASQRSPRLTSEDWVNTAFNLLVDEGISAIKLARLCEILSVTKGSFYWHFADIDGLHEAMADAWCAESNDAVRGLAQLDSEPASTRLEFMAARLIDPSSWAREAAIRDWAQENPRVQQAVHTLDQRIFTTVQSALLDTGFSTTDARLRAGILVYSGIGFVHARKSLPTPTPEEIHEVFALLTTPEQPKKKPK